MLTTKINTVNLLSIDGGGIRGIIAARILYLIETELDVNIYDFFDIFTGTSIGAIITSSIVYGKYTGKDVYETLTSNDNINKIMKQSLMDKIFSNIQIRPKYNGIEKRKLIESSVLSNTFKDTDKKILIPCFNIDLHKTHYFKSWDNIDGAQSVLDIVDASSAAPSYFPGVKIGSYNFIDGAISSNNPTDVAYCETLKIFPNGSKVKILSIGSGKVRNHLTYFNNWGGIQWAAVGGIFSLVMQGVDDITDYKTKNLSEYLKHKYIRLNGYIDNGSIDDISEENIKKLVDYGDKWFNNKRQELMIFFKV